MMLKEHIHFILGITTERYYCSQCKIQTNFIKMIIFALKYCLMMIVFT